MHFSIKKAFYFLCKLLFICCCCTFFHAPSFAQESDTNELKYYPIRVLQAKKLLNSHRYQEALKVIEKIKIGFPHQGHFTRTLYASLLVMEGQAQYGLGNLDSSLRAFLESVALKEQSYGKDHYMLTQEFGNIGRLLMELGRYQEALPYFEKMLEINRDHLIISQESKEMRAYAYSLIGDYYEEIEDYKQALEYYWKEHEIIQEQLKGLANWLGSNYQEISGIYLKTGDLEQALYYAEEAVKTLENQKGFEGEYALALNNLANYYRDVADYERESLLLQKSVATYLKIHDEHNFYLYRPYNHLGVNAANRGEYGEAIAFLKKAETVFKEKNIDIHPELISLYGNQARVYSHANKLDSSILLNQRAMELAKRLPESRGHGKNQTLTHLHNLGANYQSLGKYEQAQLLLDQAALLSEMFYSDASPSPATIYSNQALNLCYLGRFQEAQSVFIKALDRLGYDGVKTLPQVKSLPVLIDVLLDIGKAHRLWFEAGQEIGKLVTANRYYHQSEKALSYYAKRFTPLSKYALLSYARSTYEGLAHCQLELYRQTDSLHYQTNAFIASEASRSSLLFNAVQTSEALASANIAPRLLQKEKELRTKMTYWEKQRYGQLGILDSAINSTVSRISDTLLQLNEAYQSLQATLEADYPQYHEARYGQESLDPQKIQQDLLAPDQTLVEYLLSDSSMYIFVIRQDTFLTKEIKLNIDLEALIQQLCTKGIYGFHTLPLEQRTSEAEEESIINYADAASALYRLLWVPIHKEVTKRVIVIPDQKLAYLPFEALLEKSPDRYGRMRQYDFLLKKHSISYAYSAALLLKMKQRDYSRAKRGSFVGFAPFSGKSAEEQFAEVSPEQTLRTTRDTLSTLPHSQIEIEQINTLYSGDIWLGETGTIDRFIAQADQYRIVHLSTHAKANQRSGNFAFLSFQKASGKRNFVKLYARDLYNLKIPADLIVLSACETGLGRLRRGEGVISLARAFTFAGAKSIVNTLWSVDDASTATLMFDFYTELKKGLHKDQALRNAKLKYLKDTNTPLEKLDPFFWAAPIIIGDTAVLNY